jgi:hypothetical protein
VLIRTHQNNVAHQKGKSVQIVNAKELSRSQKGTHFKVKKQLLVYCGKCKSPPLPNILCLSLEYQRFCAQDKSGFAELYLMHKFLRPSLASKPC